MSSIPFLSLGAQHAFISTQLKDVLTKGFEKNWYILGNSLKNFEEEYARFSGVSYCLGVGNGYDALTLALRACSVGPGDEVLIPANTYIATWLAVSRTGAKIIPVEPDPATFTLDLNDLERKINKKSKLILPVHLYGYPCDMTRLVEIARRHQLLIIEDNAQGHGASWDGRMTGSFGDINATSFYPTKNLGALGDGGAITTKSEQLAEFVRRDRNYGFSSKDHCEQQGINSRLDELQAAVLSVKLKYLSQWNNERRRIALQYSELLKGVGDLTLPTEQKGAHHVYHLFVIRSVYRDQLKEFLKDCRVETMIHYPIPPHMQKAYSSLGFKKGDFPITEEMANTSLSLPLYPGLTESQTQFICDKIQTFFKK